LLHVWRLSGAPVATMSSGPERTRTVERFRELVELHFAEHWPVSRYVQLLGVSEDRLHAVCTKETGRGPLALIHARLIKEARLRLERSAVPIEKVAARLGFADPAYFNRFFKKQLGVSPGVYRRSALEQRRNEHETFAAWP
jgi:AraC-like DNA-binding protein